jgi:hypothetical protein
VAAASGDLEVAGVGDLVRSLRVLGETWATCRRRRRLCRPIVRRGKDALELCSASQNGHHPRGRRRNGCHEGTAGGRRTANADRQQPWNVAAGRRQQRTSDVAAGAAERGSAASCRSLHGRILADCSRGSPSLRWDGARCDSRPQALEGAASVEQWPYRGRMPLVSGNRAGQRQRREEGRRCVARLSTDRAQQNTQGRGGGGGGKFVGHAKVRVHLQLSGETVNILFFFVQRAVLSSQYIPRTYIASSVSSFDSLSVKYSIGTAVRRGGVLNRNIKTEKKIKNKGRTGKGQIKGNERATRWPTPSLDSQALQERTTPVQPQLKILFYKGKKTAGLRTLCFCGSQSNHSCGVPVAVVDARLSR